MNKNTFGSSEQYKMLEYLTDKITIIFTNWKRRDNLKQIVDKTLQQTLRPHIVVVDNNSQNNDHNFKHENKDVEVIAKTNHLMCWERWVVSLNYSSEYVCIMDDDIIFTKDDVLERCYEYMNKKPHVDAIGFEGVIFQKNKGYFTSDHHQNKEELDTVVSMIKGRFMFIRKSSLNFNLKPDLTCDDIKISSELKVKILPSVLYNCFRDLPWGDESVSLKHYQQNAREFAKQQYFKNYK